MGSPTTSIINTSTHSNHTAPASLSKHITGNGLPTMKNKINFNFAGKKIDPISKKNLINQLKAHLNKDSNKQ